jgi:hypothetical protein
MWYHDTGRAAVIESMHGKERKVARPDNPERYGSRVITSFFLERKKNDHVNSTRLVDNPMTPASKLETSKYALDKKYIPYVMPFLLRDSIVDAFLHRSRDEISRKVKAAGNLELEVTPAFMIDRFPMIKTRETINLEAVKNSIEHMSFPLNPDLPDAINNIFDFKPRDALPDSFKKILDAYDLLKREVNVIGYYSDCTPERILCDHDSYLERDVCHFNGSFKYVPRCISDGRFKKVEEINLIGDDYPSKEPVKVNKLENLDKEGLPVLRTLNVNNNNLRDLDGLDGHVDSLDELWMSSNKLVNLDGIERFNSLKVFDAFSNQINDISALSGTTSLRNITLEDNDVTTIPDISKTRIKFLNLKRNKVEKLPSTSYFPKNISELILVDNPVDNDECREFGIKLRKLNEYASVRCQRFAL